MKRITSALSFYSLLAYVLFSASGCLKDKAFEDQEYGISITEKKAVAFPQSPRSPVTVGITGSADPVIVAGPLLTLEGEGAATANVNVKLAFDDQVVTAKGLVPLPAGSYSISTLDPVIAANTKSLQDLKITVLNSNLLDPAIKYGVGIKIVSADQGYQIAANMDEVIIGFAIKNKYDGVYRLQGYHNRTTPNYSFPYDTEIHLVTDGPSTVLFYWPEVRDFGHPIGISPTSTSWYGTAIGPAIVFDQTTDLVTDVYNNGGATPITMFTGAGSRISKYDPATKAITVDWNYNNNPARAFFDDLTYIGPRP